MSFEDVEDAFGLSPIQAGMLYDCLISPDQNIHVTYITLEISGEVDSDRFRESWVSTFHQYQSLRAEYHWDGLDEPLQVIRKNIVLNWRTEDWSQLARTEQNVKLSEIIQSEHGAQLELSKAPLSRFVFVRFDKTDYRLIWSVHHLLADGASIPEIISAVLKSYNTQHYFVSTDENAYQYSQYLNWLNQQDQKLALSYWHSYLQDVEATPTRLRQFSNNAESQQSLQSIPEVNFALSESKTEALTTYLKINKITLSTFLHGIWALLIRLYSGSESPLFACTVSGRHSDVAGMSNAVGLYLNAQPRNITVSNEMSIQEWFIGIQKSIQEGATFDYSSLHDIQKVIVNESEDPVIESIITIAAHSTDLDRPDFQHDLHIKKIHYQITQSQYQLALLANPGNTLTFSLLFKPTRYHEQDIKCLSIHVLGLIDEILLSKAKTPKYFIEQYARDIDYCEFDEPEKKLLLTDQNISGVHEWFEATAELYPDNICVTCEGKSITFAKMNALANQFARLVLDICKSKDIILVGLMLPRSIEQIAGLLGILKAGYAYVPIDPDYPSTTLAVYAKAASFEYVLTTDELAKTSENLSLNVIPAKNVSGYSTESVAVSAVNPDDLAYVMFTSGSSGVPKGVKITHANLIYSTSVRIDYYGRVQPRFLLLSSIAFDSSVAGIYWCLFSGGHLILPRPGQEKDLKSTSSLIEQHNVTHTLCLPSYYYLMLQHAPIAELKRLEVVIVAGEACPPEIAVLHSSSDVNSHLYNEYGPTEASVWSSAHKVPDYISTHSALEVPIGKPIGTTYMQVVDEQGMPCPVGVTGEIVIGGHGVSQGYINNASETAEKFLVNPSLCYPDVIYKTGDMGYVNEKGDFVCIGRADRQLKIRGYRIEPGDVESAINRHPSINQSLVVAMRQSELSVVDESTRDQIIKRISDFPEHKIQEAMRKLNLSGL